MGEKKNLANVALSKLNYLAKFTDNLPEMPDVEEHIRLTKLSKQKITAEAPSFFSRAYHRVIGFFSHKKPDTEIDKNKELSLNR